MIHPESLAGLMGINHRNLEIIQPLNRRKYFPQADDKLQTKTLLEDSSVPVPRTHAVIDSYVEIDAVWEQLIQLENIVIKPTMGKGGGGILVLQNMGEGSFSTPSGRIMGRDAILKHIGDILFGVFSFGNPTDKALVEERIIPHDFFHTIYDRGVADLRIIVLKGEPVMAMLRVPTSRSDGKANLHQGAVGIAVSLADGMLSAGSLKGESISLHPDSQVEFRGRVLPLWPDVLETAVKAASCVNLGYVGVDIVIDAERGPLVLELNARPGLEIQVVNGTGLRTVLEDAL